MQKTISQDKLGHKLRVLRGDMTLNKLASETGLCRSCLSKAEMGKTDLSVGTLLRICKGLGVSPAEVLEGIGC